jgi:cbb3-type cytochrome oxidase subunit 3
MLYIALFVFVLLLLVLMLLFLWWWRFRRNNNHQRRQEEDSLIQFQQQVKSMEQQMQTGSRLRPILLGANQNATVACRSTLKDQEIEQLLASIQSRFDAVKKEHSRYPVSTEIMQEYDRLMAQLQTKYEEYKKNIECSTYCGANESNRDQTPPVYLPNTNSCVCAQDDGHSPSSDAFPFEVDSDSSSYPEKKRVVCYPKANDLLKSIQKEITQMIGNFESNYLVKPILINYLERGKE